MRHASFALLLLVACGAPAPPPAAYHAVSIAVPVVPTSAPPPPAPTPIPTPPPEPATAYLGDLVQLSVGDAHVCALTKAQHVVCWGDNSVGQLGVAAPESLTRPHRVSGLPNARVIAAGHLHTCAVSADGEVYCWGSAGGDVRISEGGIAASMELHGPALGTPVRMALGADRAISVVLSSREDTACAVFETDVRCWSTTGAIPIDPRTTKTPAPKLSTTPLRDVSALAIGHGSVCAVTHDQLWCWRVGKTGAPTLAKTRVPPARVAIGESYACVSGTGGELSCWTSGLSELWMKLPSLDVRWPKKVPTLAIAVGDSPICSVDRNGRVDCFLAKETGLPDQAVARSWATRKMAAHPIAGIDGAVDLGLGAGRNAFGYGFGCAIRREPDPDGAQVFCWGDNDAGQLGSGTTAPSIQTAVRVLGAR